MALFNFSKWQLPPFWIFKILTIRRVKGSNCIKLPNFVAICQTIAEVRRFSIFQNGGCRHLGLLKFIFEI